MTKLKKENKSTTMTTSANRIVRVWLCLWLLLSMARVSAAQDDLCPAAEECHCYNAWEEDEVRADCLGDVTHVSGELPLNLTQLRISDSAQFTHLLSNNMSKYDELNMVEIYTSALDTIDSGAFNGLENMEYLFIVKNTYLESMPSGVLNPMSRLRFLDLSMNALTTSIFGIFSGISSLSVIRLDSNPMPSNLPANAFGNNVELETIYLTSTGLTGIEANAFHNMQGMISVYLDFNDIAQLSSSAFSGLDKVDNLHLAFNQLEALPADLFTSMPTVTYLDLSHNNIANIHDNTFRNLPNLKTLNINVNQLTVIPSTALKQITSLDFINLSGNKLTTISANAFAGLEKLNSISVCDMPTLTHIDETAFNDLANLTSLSMYNNPTLVTLTPEHLPDAQHQTLQILSIPGNAFRHLDLELFINKPNLKRVDLTDNPYHCDCDLRWMIEAYEDLLVWTKHWDDEGQIPIRCQTPVHLLSFEVLSMRPRDFTCDPPEIIRVSTPSVTTELYTDVVFEAHAYNGIPATRWRGPKGAEHIPVRPFPESYRDSRRKRDSAIILPFEEFNSTEMETVVMATLELRSVNQSFSGTYEVTASNHIANVTMTFELEVLPYELTSYEPTTEVEGRAASVVQTDSVMALLLTAIIAYLNVLF